MVSAAVVSQGPSSVVHEEKGFKLKSEVTEIVDVNIPGLL